MALHEPHSLIDQDGLSGGEEIVEPDEARRELYERVKDVCGHEFLFDVACGNPPYVGEKRAAPVLRRTRQEFPYWDQYAAAHLDVLYWFLILGVSKLREGGRFGFITTDYWLRREGAEPTRRYLVS